MCPRGRLENRKAERLMGKLRPSFAMLAPGIMLALWLMPEPALAQAGHELPPQPGTNWELDPEALKRAKPAERNLPALPPEVLAPEGPKEDTPPPKAVPGR
ncbi:MAG TPA: hypothetical protein VFF88_03490 [Methylocella sp.]|nr:hypothetical protein [Methylocella sp.]